AEERAEEDEGQSVSETVELGPEARPRQQGCREERCEGVPGSDGGRNERVRPDRDVEEERRHGDRRPDPTTQEQQSDHGDPGRRPDGGDLSLNEGQAEAEASGDVVGASDEHESKREGGERTRTGPEAATSGRTEERRAIARRGFDWHRLDL